MLSDAVGCQTFTVLLLLRGFYSSGEAIITSYSHKHVAATIIHNGSQCDIYGIYNLQRNLALLKFTVNLLSIVRMLP
ncbi:hypothetical protein C8Q75DRAFT_742500 [Abortiporus biennis]|nr:hypothetical protein C8Q75DRAFT_742500 [Abortiporus biennis]